jgi:hypothetical protein
MHKKIEICSLITVFMINVKLVHISEISVVKWVCQVKCVNFFVNFWWSVKPDHLLIKWLVITITLVCFNRPFSSRKLYAVCYVNLWDFMGASQMSEFLRLGSEGLIRALKFKENPSWSISSENRGSISIRQSLIDRTRYCKSAVVVGTVGLVGNRHAYEAVGRMWIRCGPPCCPCLIHILPIAECRLSISSTVLL